MASFSKTILLGHLGNDPDLKYMTNGEPVAKFSLATSEYWTDRNGQKQTETEWHTVSCFGKTAENVGKYLKKGSAVLVEGKNKTRSWDDKDTGKKRYATEVVAHNISFVNGGSGGGGGQQRAQNPDQGHATGPAPTGGPVDLNEIPF